jgi:hypothetical protein
MSSIRFIDAGQVVEHVVMALAVARAAGDPAAIPSPFKEGDSAVVRQWPPWVARAGVLRSRGTWWLWCEPRKGSRPGMSQFVMDLPAGRYMIDVMDTRTHGWFSRESAAGGPLVVGLPAAGRPVLVRIRRVASSRTASAGDAE